MDLSEIQNSPDLQKIHLVNQIKKIRKKREPKPDTAKITRKRKIKILENPPLVIEEKPFDVTSQPIKVTSQPIKVTSQPKKTRKRKIKVSSKSPIRFSPTQAKMVPATMPPIVLPEPTIKRWNEDFIDILDQLSNIEFKKGDHIRGRAYKKAQETIMEETGDIVNIQQLKGKPGIGPTILKKLQEYVDTGFLEKIEREKQKPEYILSNIYGVGPKKAKELVEKGIKSIAELRERQDELLNAVQKVGLQYYEDIEERIPRSEIDEYHTIFDAVYREIQKSDPSMKYEIVGSYRRGAKASGDIDIIITSALPNSFNRFIDTLTEQGIILEILSRGNSKCLVITKIPEQRHARRVDFLYASPKEYPFSVLYFTGSKAFNTVMRGHALKMGYSMNEHGFSKMEGKQKAEQLIPDVFTTELDIFNFLGLQYKRPEERIDGRSVIIGTNEPDVIVKSITPMPEQAIVKPVNTVKIKKVKEPKVKKVKSPKTEKVKKVKEPKEPKIKKVKSPKPAKTEKIKKVKEPKEPKIKKVKSPKTEKVKKVKVSKEPKVKKVKSPKTEKVKKVKEPKNKTKKMDINIIGDRILPKDSILIMNEKIQEPPLNNIQPEQIITDFKMHGLSVLEKLAESDLNQLIILANDRYYNEDPIMTDNEYDILKEFIERKFPKNTVIDAIGAPISAKNKVKLPYEMWSMDKIKPDSNALAQWKAKYKGPYTLSCKLDGVSGMYVKDSSNQYKLYTRGNGLVGQDISHLIEPLHLPKTVPTGAIRGEFIIPKRVFQEKYKDKFANPRNMVAGMINKQSWDDRINDLKFVTYEIIEPKMEPSKQLQTLQSMGFDTVMFKVETEATLTNELLSALLLDWRQNNEFEIDGIIVTDDHVHDRVSKNPEHAFAFKMVISDQMAEAKVVDVLWEASKSGYLKPRVRIEPIQLGGVRIEYATGFNGKFIEDNRIGLGAIIQIVRSGDVIPYIQSIVQPAEFTKMPEQAYHWTDSHVDIILDDLESDPKVLEKNIAAFFVELEVDGLAKGNIKRLIDAGFDSVAKILQMTKADFERVGFKALADKFVSGIASKVVAATLPQIMSASNKLGRGISGKTIEIIMTEEPAILTSIETDESKIAKLVKIKGVGKVVAKTFVEHIREFLAFLWECGLEYKLHSVGLSTEVTAAARQFDETNPLFGKKIVMTKVRDQDIIKKMEESGAILADSVTADTFAVIVKSKEDMSGKVKKALDKGIPVMTPDEFKTMYMA